MMGLNQIFLSRGSVEEYFPDEEQKKIIEKFIEAFGAEQLSMAGIDFILTRDGNLILMSLRRWLVQECCIIAQNMI